MTRKHKLLSPLIFVIAATAATAQSPLSKEETTFRQQRQTDLGRPDGLLSVQRGVALRPGTYTVGSAADSQVKQAHLPEHLGQLVVDDAGAVILRQPGAADQPLPLTKTNDLHLSTDVGWVHSGPVSFAYAPIQGGTDLLVKDRQAPDVLSYPGLRWFPVSAAWRVQARWVPYTTEHPLEISLRNGRIVHEPAQGYAEFQIAGQTYKLDGVEDDGFLFFVIGDKTNGTTSYGAGRFIEGAVASHGIKQPGTIVLDFNKLVNPYCAYSLNQNCPRPTKANTLPIAIPAGEMPFPGEPK